MIPFAAIVTPESIVFTDAFGKTITITNDDTKKFNEAKNLIRHLNKMKSDGYEEEDSDFISVHTKLIELVNPPQKIVDQDGVCVKDGVVYYNGIPFHSILTERILWGIKEGFDMIPYISFLENLMLNPSKRAVDELFGFIEKHKMGITSDGYILAYKRVRDDFKDIHSGTLDNTPGSIVSMPRNQVNDDPNQTCSTGLHFCSMDYLPNYGVGPGSKIVIVKVNPADVVSVPVDYDAAKVRCCEYEVIDEYLGSDKEDLLKTKPVWNTSDFNYSQNYEEELPDDFNDDTETEYDRGYNFGYYRGFIDAEEHQSQPDNIHFDGHSETWTEGFFFGWRDGVESYLHEHSSEDEAEGVPSDTDESANYDTGVVFDGDTLQSSNERTPQTDMGHLATVQVQSVSPERDVNILSATPPHPVPATGFITVNTDGKLK